MFKSEGVLLKGSESNGALPNGVYAVIQMDDNFIKCLCENITNGGIEYLTYVITSAKFMLVNLVHDVKVEQCFLENFFVFGGESWVIKFCEEDDNLSELYGGVMEDSP